MCHLVLILSSHGMKASYLCNSIIVHISNFWNLNTHRIMASSEHTQWAASSNNAVLYTPVKAYITFILAVSVPSVEILHVMQGVFTIKSAFWSYWRIFVPWGIQNKNQMLAQIEYFLTLSYCAIVFMLVFSSFCYVWSLFSEDQFNGLQCLSHCICNCFSHPGMHFKLRTIYYCRHLFFICSMPLPLYHKQLKQDPYICHINSSKLMFTLSQYLFISLKPSSACMIKWHI